MFNATNFSQCGLLQKIISKQDHVYLGREREKGIILLLYATVIISGVWGNLFVMVTILTHRSLRTLRTALIAQLAFSDLILCILTAPTTLAFYFNSFWTLGNLACKFTASVQAVNTFLSVFTLTAIAWDRYLLIAFPIAWKRPNSALLCFIASVWFLSVLVGAPYFFAVRAVPFKQGVWGLPIVEDILSHCGYGHPQVCAELLPAGGLFSKKTFTVATVACQYLFPLSGLLFVYCKIVRRTLCGRRSRRRHRKIFLVTSLVCVFGVCWLPSNLYCVLDALGIVSFNQFHYIYFHLFGMVTACVNPVLYGLLNTNVRKSVAVTLNISGNNSNALLGASTVPSAAPHRRRCISYAVPPQSRRTAADRRLSSIDSTSRRIDRFEMQPLNQC